MLDTLATAGLVTPSLSPHGSPCFAVYKTAVKARLIADMRQYNTLWPRPPPFSLPSLDLLLNTTLPALYFIKIDISNFYWSLELPPPVRGAFVLSTGSRCFQTRKLPFGWSWSPFLAQETLRGILHSTRVLLGGLVWQFVDDVLLASPDPCFLHSVGTYLVHVLSTFHLHINHKSVLIPTQQLLWLGKCIDATAGSIHNQPHRIAHALARLWFLRCTHLSFRSLQKLLGLLQWLQCPNSLSAPFLASSYALLRQSSFPILLPKSLWVSLLHAVLFVILPLRARPLPPPLCMPLVFCDAATFGSCFLVGVWKRDSFASVVDTPRWVTSLQQAELYAVFHAVRLLSLRSFSSACLVTDNLSTFFTVTAGRIAASPHTRLRLLRRINRICLSSPMQLEMALVPSRHNPADPYSRLSCHHPLSVDAAARSRFCLSSLTKLSTAVKRFWWCA